MANIKSAKKRSRQNEEQRQRNIAVKSRMRTFMKKTLQAIDSGNQDEIKTILPQALSEIDRAATKGVIKANSASRKKSTLQRRAAAVMK